MNIRNLCLSAVWLLCSSAVTFGKPPGLPVDPHVEGKEASPVAREFYQSDARMVCGGQATSNPDAFWTSLHRVLPQIFGHAWAKPTADQMDTRR